MNTKFKDSFKTIRRFQINGIKCIQLSVFFNISVEKLTTLNHAFLSNTWYYLNKDGKVRTLNVSEVEYSISCKLGNKDVFMSVVEINDKLTPVFQPLDSKLEYVDLMGIPEY